MSGTVREDPLSTDRTNEDTPPLRFVAVPVRLRVMEGYLIRVPACAWASDEVDDGSGASKKGKRVRRSCKPQARLLYYVLGEGYLEGFASPDDMEPIETFQLTSFQVEVEPIYSMLMFRVTTREKRPAGYLPPPPAIGDHLSGDSSDDDSDEGHTHPSRAAPASSSLLLFAGNKSLVELWGRKILNWNRYVFAGGDSADQEASELVKVKADLIGAFHDQNNRGMFAVFCQLDDATAKPLTTPTTVSPDEIIVKENMVRSPPPVIKPSDVEKPGATEIKPLWMLLNRSSSRRISAVPPRK